MTPPNAFMGKTNHTQPPSCLLCIHLLFHPTNTSQCLKITENVSSNIVSEVSYVLSGKKFIKNTKKVYFGEVLKTVVPDRSLLKGQKLVENAKISIFVLLNHPSQTFLFGKNESSWLVYK